MSSLSGRQERPGTWSGVTWDIRSGRASPWPVVGLPGRGPPSSSPLATASACDSSETLPLPLGAFVVGSQARSSFTDIDGHQHGVQVELSDAGAVTLFGDVSDLSDATIPIDQALGGQAERLVDQLSDAASWEARFALLDGFFAALAARSVSPEASWLRRQLVATGGRARVEPMTDETGCSRRLVTERFRRQFGVPPKTYSRIPASGGLWACSTGWGAIALSRMLPRSAATTTSPTSTGISPPWLAALMRS